MVMPLGGGNPFGGAPGIGGGGTGMPGALPGMSAPTTPMGGGIKLPKAPKAPKIPKPKAAGIGGKPRGMKSGGGRGKGGGRGMHGGGGRK